jgi:hypothetical protein
MINGKEKIMIIKKIINKTGLSKINAKMPNENTVARSI